MPFLDEPLSDALPVPEGAVFIAVIEALIVIEMMKKSAPPSLAPLPAGLRIITWDDVLEHEDL